MLYDKLKKNGRIPFHMPGHKRNVSLLGSKLPYDIDITEIDGFDNLHCPSGVIKEIEKKTQRFYNSDNSFILVNGSTAGILAGVCSALKRGDKVLLSRNSHKSVYNAVELAGADAEYIVPDTDEYGIYKPVDISELELKISEVNPRLIIITSPTYEGVKSDIRKICETAHKRSIPVMVDAAHGADYTDEANVADITIMSLHKTLPALTQCAVAHINGSLISAEEFRIKLSVFETSSPSYVLMASVEECLDFVEKNNFLYQRLIDERKKLFDSLRALKRLRAFEYDSYTKLVVFSGYSDISGIELAEKLRSDYNIEVEMARQSYIVLITTICDDFNNYTILGNALIEIDKNLRDNAFVSEESFSLPEKKLRADEIKSKESVPFLNAEGRISAEYIWAYPPGIPLIVPGEVISARLIETVTEEAQKGTNIQSTYFKVPEKIYCQC